MNIDNDFLKKTLFAAAESYPHEIPHEEYNKLVESVDEKFLIATWVYMHEKGLITKVISLGMGGSCTISSSPKLTAYGIDYVQELNKQEG